jgi:hypothetical protein
MGEHDLGCFSWEHGCSPREHGLGCSLRVLLALTHGYAWGTITLGNNLNHVPLKNKCVQNFM